MSRGVSHCAATTSPCLRTRATIHDQCEMLGMPVPRKTEKCEHIVAGTGENLDLTGRLTSAVLLICQALLSCVAMSCAAKRTG